MRGTRPACTAPAVPDPHSERSPATARQGAIEDALRGFLGLGGTIRFTPRIWLVHDDLALGSTSFVMDGGRDPEGNPIDLRGVTAEVCRRQADGT